MLFICSYTVKAQYDPIPDGFISSVNKVIKDYPNRFVNLMGRSIPELVDYGYESRITIPGSSYCRIINTNVSGLYFNASYIALYSETEEAYSLALKQFNTLVSYFENSTFLVPMAKGVFKQMAKKEDMGQQQEQSFNGISSDQAYKDLQVKVNLAMNYYIKDQSKPDTWQQYYEVSIKIKR